MEVDFFWNDIGSWTSLNEVEQVDQDNNVIRGNHLGIDTKNCVVWSDKKHLIGTIGVSDLVIIQTEDATLVCSGDTDYSQDLILLSRNADLLICEAALPDGKKVEGHMTPSLAGDIAAKAGVKKLVLTHFYPECDKVDLRAQCRKTYSGPLVLARDLLEMEW